MQQTPKMTPRYLQKMSSIQDIYEPLDSNQLSVDLDFDSWKEKVASPERSRSGCTQIEELQRCISKLNLENEELKYELKEARKMNQQLIETIEEKDEIIREKETIQSRMGRQLDIVTQTAYTLYEKFRAFKCRYYEEQKHNALLGCAAEK